MAHLVAFRTSEIGLRMALGASPGAVMRMVLGHGRRLTLAGIAIGIAGALVVSRLMQQALFEVDPAEPLVYIALSITLLLVGINSGGSHQSIGLVIGQRPQKHGVDDAEERAVGADTEREAGHGDEGEAG